MVKTNLLRLLFSHNSHSSPTFSPYFPKTLKQVKSKQNNSKIDVRGQILKKRNYCPREEVDGEGGSTIVVSSFKWIISGA